MSDSDAQRIANVETGVALLSQKIDTTNRTLDAHILDSKELYKTLNEKVDTTNDAYYKIRQTLLMFQWITLGCGLTILAFKYGIFEVMKGLIL